MSQAQSKLGLWLDWNWFNPILHGINSNLFYTGGGIYAPPMISRKLFFTQFLLHTQTATQNRVTHKKIGLYLKNKKIAAVLKSPSENCGKNVVNILHFLPFSLKWL